MQQERQQLEEEERNLAQVEHDLKARESKVAELERELPLAQKLQGMKVDGAILYPFMDLLHEYSISHNTDLTTADF